MTRAPLLTLFLVGCWPFIVEPHPREDVPLEADTDVDADADADTDVDTDTDADVDCPTPDADLRSDLGDALITGNTCVGEDDYAKPSDCGGVPGPDVAFAWTAPYDGVFQVDLLGSDAVFDTVLVVQSACPEPTVLECNDDFGSNVQSGVERAFVADQPVVFIVEGFNINCGNFQLNIHDVSASQMADQMLLAAPLPNGLELTNLTDRPLRLADFRVEQPASFGVYRLPDVELAPQASWSLEAPGIQDADVFVLHAEP